MENIDTEASLLRERGRIQTAALPVRGRKLKLVPHSLYMNHKVRGEENASLAKRTLESRRGGRAEVDSCRGTK